MSSSACPFNSPACLPPGVPRWGAAHKDFMRKYFNRCIAVHGPVQEMPVFDARVQVDPRVVDDWGIPVARLSGARHPQDLDVANYISGKAAAWLKEAGAITTWPKLPGKGLSGGQHQAGTCRMGNDPKTSVVNRYCQVHDVANLFVVDASVHVTNGGFNPALTIMAIAYMASEHIVTDVEGNENARLGLETGGWIARVVTAVAPISSGADHPVFTILYPTTRKTHDQHRSKSRYLRLVLIALGAAILTLPGASIYYEYSGGKACARCHEIWQPYSDWHTSTHRNIACGACHGNVFTLEAGFHINNMRRVLNHLSGDVPEQVRLQTRDVFRVTERCQNCHQQEWAEWASGLHHAAYKEIFLDAKHNHKRLLMDDCLRCHGTHFDGSIRDLVTPIDTQGPWKLRDPALADRPVIVCLNCHMMHHHGNPLARPAEKPSTSTSAGIEPAFGGAFRPARNAIRRRWPICPCPRCARASAT